MQIICIDAAEMQTEGFLLENGMTGITSLTGFLDNRFHRKG